MTSSPRPSHTWKFFRSGGLDQVLLENGDDLRALPELDQKLWVALSCPVKGIELDEKTLQLIDTDGDGRIRVPELLAAVKWASARLKDPGTLLREGDALPIDAINPDAPDGQIIIACARRVLARLGRGEATSISLGEVGDTTKIYAASPLNGSGVIPPEASEDAAVQALIKDIIASTGGAVNRSGATGVTAAQVDAFFAELTAYLAWIEQSGNKDIAVLGDATEPAVAAIRAVREKVDDYFARCSLAAFDPRAAAALNRSEADYQAFTAKSLTTSTDEIAAFPLARVEPDRPLPLLESVNPAWAAALATLQARAVAPVFGPEKTTLTAREWKDLVAGFAPYQTWLGAKPGGIVEKLGIQRLRAIASGPERAVLTDLLQRDQALAPEFNAVHDLERLVRYQRDLATLLRNFVNFADFYSPERAAVFQAGTLYLDSRSADLCIRVDGPNPLAAMSKACIAYCTCTRGAATFNIAACFTQGDSDYLFVGRRGVFYDRKGQDWDAVITQIVDNPISLREAFFSPYKKFVRMIEEQVAKRAAAAEAESTSRVAAAAETTANIDKAPKPPPQPKKIDVGTVAALGVAVGGITAAFGTILGAFLGLGFWMPAGILGIMLAISGPSMLIAAIKLRQRTLGPILEGSGWAVNGRVKINVPLGTALTKLPKLPPGSQRTLNDPYEDVAARRRRRRAIFIFVVLVLALVATLIRWHRLKSGHYFWQPAPETTAPAPEAPAEPAEPAA